MERLDIYLGSVSLVIDQFNDGLQGHSTNLTEEEIEILLFYRGQLEELTVLFTTDCC